MNNRLEWLTNTPSSRFNALDYPHYKMVTGQPLGTSTHTAEELDSMGVVGVYRVIEENPKMVIAGRFPKDEGLVSQELPAEIVFFDDKGVITSRHPLNGENPMGEWERFLKGEGLTIVASDSPLSPQEEMEKIGNMAMMQMYRGVDSPPDTPKEMFTRGFMEVLAGDTYPIEQLWDGIDAE